MLENLSKQHQIKTRDIFLLALNYHAVDSGDFSKEDKKIFSNKLINDWKKYNDKLISNGHESMHLLEIQTLSDAHDTAYCVLNNIDKIRKKYAV